MANLLFFRRFAVYRQLQIFFGEMDGSNDAFQLIKDAFSLHKLRARFKNLKLQIIR